MGSLPLPSSIFLGIISSTRSHVHECVCLCAGLWVQAKDGAPRMGGKGMPDAKDTKTRTPTPADATAATAATAAGGDDLDL